MRRESSGLRAFLVFGLLLAATTIGLLGCGQSLSSSTSSAATSTPSASAITASTTTTTTSDPDTMTTSLAVGFASSRGVGVVQEFGDAVVSYLNGKGDLAAVQALVAPSAQEGLDQMLSLLNQPTRCKVMMLSNYGSSNESEVDLLFAGGTTEPTHLYVTILVDMDAETIAITAYQLRPHGEPSRADHYHPQYHGHHHPGAKRDRLRSSRDPDPDRADAWVHVSELGPIPTSPPRRSSWGQWSRSFPFGRTPWLATGDSDGSNEHQPIVYKGYVLEVERAYGPETIPKQITVYALGNGTVELDGTTYEVREEFPLDASPGDRLFVPLMKVPYFGTPELEADEYWVQANWAVFAVDDNGNCTRVTGADIDREVRSEFPLSAPRRRRRGGRQGAERR